MTPDLEVKTNGKTIKMTLGQLLNIVILIVGLAGSYFAVTSKLDVQAAQMHSIESSMLEMKADIAKIEDHIYQKGK